MSADLPNPRHISVFLEAVRLGSVSKGAEACNLSQPAASQAIARLEQDFGVQLLHRVRARFGPTAYGAVLQPRAEVALSHLRALSIERSVTAAQLRTLLAIGDQGSFTLAAQALGLSQPTVHRSARTLEAIIKQPLFQARPSGVSLTPTAEAIARAAKLAQAELRQAREEIGRLQGDDRATFRLGSLPLSRTAIVPAAICEMVDQHGQVQISVVDGRYGTLLKQLREGELDCLIGALRAPSPAEDVVQDKLFSDALAIVAHPTHPLASRSHVQLEETLDFPWIAPPKDTPAGQYLFDTLRIQARERSPVRAVSSSLVLLRAVLAGGDFVSIVSRHQVSVEEAAGHITPLNVRLSGHHRDIGLTFRKGWKPTATQSQFIDYLRKHSRACG